ncbi:Fur family transcriptional regulator [Fredinandcohnia sp. QZ13]|uniref:Fur family transcriptional regulator n=1 Tax=Fredinandcohnia sp. QZ13 TaxID=3073144 RepID=UPI00285322CF|nr:Fur family transcriptional regulator [Fredinandcohnia sp. QZ13]MDR4889931.1 Fur family transcriptional regulator [Fredinandcohnia sp. QZ13]
MQELVPFLKERGLRITPQRTLILQTILSLKGHPTVEDIHRQIPHISLATIYNNVKLFVSLRILKELPYGNGLSKYELSNQPNHYHILCEVCGDIIDFNYPTLTQIEDVANKLTKFKINSHQMEVYGLCQSCQRKEGDF